jgi:hypothetical protein
MTIVNQYLILTWSHLQFYTEHEHDVKRIFTVIHIYLSYGLYGRPSLFVGSRTFLLLLLTYNPYNKDQAEDCGIQLIKKFLKFYVTQELSMTVTANWSTLFGAK